MDYFLIIYLNSGNKLKKKIKQTLRPNEIIFKDVYSHFYYPAVGNRIPPITQQQQQQQQ